jgi:hypothetical protein
VDTSALIQARVELYPPDVFTTLWNYFEKLIDDGRLLATDEVLRELEKKDDELYQWASARKQIFIPLDETLQNRASKIINTFPSLVETKSTMRGAADPFVIALEQDRQLTVITAETSKPSKPRIPDVCKELSLSCLSLVQLFRREEWRI